MDARALPGPELARFVTCDGAGTPVVTDGPFPESKELLAGYRMIDVESPERALEIAAKASAVPFQMPTGGEWAGRLRSVLHVLYLIFNEGYVTSGGPELARSELSGEAIRLTRIVRLALPDDAEVGGLLALMLLTEARRRARTDTHGELITLDEQDRTLWNRDLSTARSRRRWWMGRRRGSRS